MNGTIEIYRQDRCENIIPLDQDEIMIGRDRFNRICLPDLGVSRYHGKISVKNSEVYFEDSSSNGTYIDGRILHKNSRPLQHGATIIVGPYRLYYNALAQGSDRRRTESHGRRDHSEKSKLKFILRFIPEVRPMVTLEDSYVTIGSDKRNHVVISDAGLAELHVSITVIDKVPFLLSYQEDVVVNGAAAEQFPLPLYHGDIVSMGGLKFSFHYEKKYADQYKYKIVTNSPLMRSLIKQIERTAQFDDVSVLLIGETGTGKELVAKAVHTVSSRATQNFIAVNCAALSPSLAESLLFGHVKGSFTTALNDHEGYFPRANGGTLFLDEIGELPPELQSKLLRAIEYKQITRVGSSEVETVDVRIIAATNRALHDPEIRKKNNFREDLYFRLRGFLLHIPALRERSEDVPLLMDHFLRVSKVKYPTLIDVKFTESAYRMAISYSWPGNVRELFQICLSAFLHANDALIEVLPIYLSKLPYEQDIPMRIRHVYHMLYSGMSAIQIADELQVSRMTAYNWKRKIEGILQKRGAKSMLQTSTAKPEDKN